MVSGTPPPPLVSALVPETLVSEQLLQVLVSEPPLGLVPSPELMRALLKEVSHLQAESQW